MFGHSRFFTLSAVCLTLATSSVAQPAQPSNIGGVIAAAAQKAAAQKAADDKTKADDQKKQDEEPTSNTNITISDGKVNYGSAVPSDILEHLRDACYDSGSCDETPIKVPVTMVNGAGTDTEEDHVVLTPHGTYDGANRDAFVDALKAAASKGPQKDTDKWAHGNAGGGIGIFDGDVDRYTYTSYLSITRIGGTGTEGMGVTISYQDDHPEPGLCEVLTTELLGIGSAVSGVAAGFFTLANAACSLDTGA